MYKLQRKERVFEQLELSNADGSLYKVIDVDLDADTTVKNISEKQIALINAQKQLQTADATNTTKTLELIGKVTVDLFEAIFGTENTQDILKFYENKPVEMCRDILPFITEVIIPQVRKTASDNKKNLLNGYKKRGWFK